MIKVFLSYSRVDEELRDELNKHLGALRHEGIIETWSDQEIPIGGDWSEEISEELEGADLILLLVSKDFLDSPFCYTYEMRRAVERHFGGLAVVIPILVHECYWAPTPFAAIQGLPRGMVAVTEMPNRDRAWAEIAEEIHQVAIEIEARRSPS
jgi:hypothetical protein